jgi:dipeptidyl-peptidase-4
VIPRSKARATAWLIFTIVVSPQLDAAELPPLSLDQLFSTPKLTGVEPSSPVWSPDSRHFAFTWNSEGMPQPRLWVASQDGDNLRRLDAQPTAAESVSDFAWLPDGKTIISLRGSGLWSTTLDREQHTLLATIGDGASNLSVSPDGSKAAYLKDGDLWLVNLVDRSVMAATDLGIPALSSLPIGRYSRPEREIGPGIWGGPTYAWSPDGQYIAVHYVDRREMRKVPFPNYLGAETEPNEVRRGYPGDANELRTVGLLRVADRDLRLLALSNPTENQVIDFTWSSDGVLLLDLASDTLEDRWLLTVKPDNGQLQKTWHSNRPSRMYTAFASTWHPDGKHVIFLSDLGDRYGLYAIDTMATNGSPKLLTDPDYDVLGSPSVVAADGTIFYSANGTGPHERHVYRVSATNGKPYRVTSMPGHNQGYPSPDGRHLAILHSDDATPPEIYVATANGDDVRRVTTSPLPEFNRRQWARARYVSFPSEIDDYTLHARILEPVDLDPGKKYPVVFGPAYSNTVRNRWAGVYSEVQQLLVQKGYVVVQVDMRGSTGYGREFREEFLLDFAGNDIEDIASAVKYIKTIPYVDSQRLGIWGSSYGGTLTTYTLLKKPGLFHVGVAGAAAVDPHFFGTDDVAIVRRPDSHPEVFENAAYRYAANLEDHLLIIHGMQDQVVPFKTTVALAEVLIKNGKDFDFAFAPGATHAWRHEPYYARFLFGKLISYFDRHLAPGVRSLRVGDTVSFDGEHE